MPSSSTHGETAYNLSKAVSALQETIEAFKIGIENGTQNLILTPIDSPSKDPHEPTLLTLLPATPETTSQLSTMDQRLQTIEQTLRSRSQWHPPPSISTASTSPLPLDLSDMQSAIDLLDQIVTRAHCPTPRPSFSSHRWTWDPAWKEFYTHDVERQTFVYLSRWKLDRESGGWSHEVMTHRVGLGPEVAAGELGTWEDWEWDFVWGEWYLDVVGEEGEMYRVCANRWRVEDGGEWVYDGGFGGVERE